ncbi:unnamed protein product [Adineta steineri]|uniref:G-protein coupled receptors family 1 profile domain-containing protein n=1 Tax=Adineta steineri TaxID=433720 RepID=A0A819BBY8_9BILA|nr:unnamed protein product [Adineta steineri]CAF3799423.1 unnamed protein product [Adineta steineri]
MMINNNTTLEMCISNVTYDKLFHISSSLWHVFGFIGVLFGIPGHILQIIISFNKTSRKQPNSLYFIAISIVEIVFLLGIFWLWCVNISFIKIDPREFLSCGIFYSIIIGSTTLSHLYLASLFIDQSMMILYPTHYRLIVTRSHIILRIVLITFIIILLSIPHHFYFHYEPRITFFLCDFNSSLYYGKVRIWLFVHAILLVGIPSLIVCISSAILLHNRCKHKRTYKNNLSINARRMHRRSILIFVYSIGLFLFILPGCILEIYMVYDRFFYHNMYCSIRWKIYRLLPNYFLILSSITYSNKFYIHLIVSTTFRNGFIQLITCKSNQNSTKSIAMNERNNNEQYLLSPLNQTNTIDIYRK